MKLIVCVDNSMGMTFGKRRQSRDEELCRDVLRYASGQLFSDEYTASLFADMEQPKNYIGGAPCDGYVFAERFLPDDKAAICEIILYRWNRDYPADRYFDVDLSAWNLVESVEFAGKSHEKITRERYVR